MFMMGIAMVYCTKCGTENEEDALECKNCGASLRVYRSRERTHDRDIEDQCFGGRSRTMWPIIMGVFIILIGLSSLLERSYSWARFDNLWPLFIIAIGLLIVYNTIQRK
jgi:uncharacterized membrane protein YvbJ